MKKKKFKKKGYRKRITVHCKGCPAFVDESTVEILNCEEDMQGHDVLTFKCPNCGNIESSKRFG